jgi:hypothetical protein
MRGVFNGGRRASASPITLKSLDSEILVYIGRIILPADWPFLLLFFS